MGRSLPDELQNADLVEELRVSHERYRFFVEQTAEGFYRIESERPIPCDASPEEQVDGMYAHMVVAECNDFFAQMYGCERADELIGRRLVELHRGPDHEENRSALRAFAEQRYRVVDLETQEAGDSGEVVILLNNAIGILEDGALVGIWGTQRDITEQRRLEEQRRALERKLRESQRLESLGVLAGGIAHDFNNILTSILGGAGVADLELPPHSPVRPMLQLIQTAAERGGKLCRQLQSYAGGCTPDLRPTDLAALVEESIALVRASVPSKNVELRADTADELPAVLADSSQLQQVLLNLLINACEAIGEAPGLVSVTVRRGADERVRLRVEDTGCGMPADYIDKVYDPFFSTKGPHEGRGLGLSTAKGIVLAHRGRIRFESEPGRGTTCIVDLPATRDTAVPAREHELPEIDTTGTALVVDDEASIRAFARTCLERLGFRVWTAADGEEALALFREQPASVALALIDVSMPRLSGPELLEEIRRLRPDLPAILSSGHDRGMIRDRIATDASTRLLSKPYRIAELVDAIRGLQQPAEHGAR